MGWFLTLILDSTDSRLKSWNQELAAECRITILLPRNNNRVVGSDAVNALYLTYATSCSVGKITIYLISASGHIREAAAIAIDFHHYAVRWRCDHDLFLRFPSGSWSQSIFSKHKGSRGAWTAVGILFCYLFSITQ